MKNFITEMLPYVALFSMLWFASCEAQKKVEPKEEKLYEVEYTDAEWQELLPPSTYRVMRKAATEYPFTSPLNKEKRGGLYVCAADSTHLFTSDDKFDSGTGWPSFDAANNLEYEWDGRALEVRCITCGGHLGHLFKHEGFTEKNLRYCINGVALRFIPD